MSWYPELDGKQMPWAIAYTPTGACGSRGRQQAEAEQRCWAARFAGGVGAAAQPCTPSWLAAPVHRAPLCRPAPAPPAEPLLAATRKLVPPFNGLDVSPIVWVALLSFLSEILTGPQGILSLIARQGSI